MYNRYRWCHTIVVIAIYFNELYNCEFAYGLRYGLYCVYWYADLCITHAMHHTHILSPHKKRDKIFRLLK